MDTSLEMHIDVHLFTCMPIPSPSLYQDACNQCMAVMSTGIASFGTWLPPRTITLVPVRWPHPQILLVWSIMNYSEWDWLVVYCIVAFAKFPVIYYGGRVRWRGNKSVLISARTVLERSEVEVRIHKYFTSYSTSYCSQEMALKARGYPLSVNP